jgi:tetratricopeptide (TPR) repeat protein
VGFLLAVLSRREEAIQSFQQALDLDPKFAPAQYHLGVAYWLEKNPGLSIPHLQSAAALEPGNFEYQYSWGKP